MIAHEMADGGIRFHVDEHLGFLTISAPQKKNALNLSMWTALPGAIDTLVEDGARAIVLTGDGENFSAGADISEFDVVRSSSAVAASYEAANSAAFATIRDCPVPVVAAIEGVCFGGGMGLAAASDLRVGADTSRYAVPAARLGLAYPADAIADFTNSLGVQWTRMALYTGRRFTALELHSLGFLAATAPEGGALPAAERIGRTIASNAPLSIRASKLAIRAALEMSADLTEMATEAGNRTFDSQDYAEGRRAFAEKREPRFTGR